MSPRGADRDLAGVADDLTKLMEALHDLPVQRPLVTLSSPSANEVSVTESGESTDIR